MKLLDYTTRAALLPRQDLPDLHSVVARLASELADSGSVLDATVLTGDVLRRESEGGTALPEGLVLPHARSEAARRVCLAVATLVKPFPARSGDGEEHLVNVAVLLTAPPTGTRQMLRVMARLAREVRGSGLLDRLRAAGTPAEMAAVLAGIDAQNPG
jgi:mannitol/fructose-specific phosphotransferase system IIA component (Ntr-type)